MDLVVDANILFAVLIKAGKTEEIIFLGDLHIFAPKFIFEEFEKYKELIIEKTQRTGDEFYKLVDILKKKIQTIPNEETEPFMEEAKQISPDANDADYFALALKLKCAIWSNDKKLKEQETVRIYSTEELMRELILRNAEKKV